MQPWHGSSRMSTQRAGRACARYTLARLTQASGMRQKPEEAALASWTCKAGVCSQKIAARNQRLKALSTRTPGSKSASHNGE